MNELYELVSSASTGGGCIEDIVKDKQVSEELVAKVLQYTRVPDEEDVTRPTG